MNRDRTCSAVRPTNSISLCLAFWPDSIVTFDRGMPAHLASDCVRASFACPSTGAAARATTRDPTSAPRIAVREALGLTRTRSREPVGWAVTCRTGGVVWALRGAGGWFFVRLDKAFGWS